MCRDFPHEKPFTLIELLVVTIIAILAAIFLPVFAAAAKKAADFSNMKQLGTGIAIYMGGHDDVYPPAASIDPSNTTNTAPVWSSKRLLDHTLKESTSSKPLKPGAVMNGAYLKARRFLANPGTNN